MSAQTELAQLHAEIAVCRKCLLAGHAITPGAVVRGVASAQFMIIGQAPGPTEVVAKRPFNAGSGKRLFQWLGEAGFDEADFRATQYMTAVTKCYPGKGKSGHGDRVPSRAEQALCRPWLDQEIALVNPRVILPVGRLAIELFFDKQPLEKIIGTQAERDGRVIIPLPHPSGASTWYQAPANQALVKQAIGLLKRQRLINNS